ncbi:MAG TPA: PIN domain-containing protein [Terriglobia bacterium]|nr:PIN domain-containing protein [Terriglobia bacterium]
MPAFLPDTSCMIAAVCSWHEHHDRARDQIETRLGYKYRMVVAGPALIEMYAVLTRLPPPYRVAASDALALIEQNFMNGAKMVVLAQSDYGELLRTAPANNISGGRAYDAVISICARKARVDALLTFNAKHFAALAGMGMEIVIP